MSEWVSPVIAGFQLSDNFFVLVIILVVGAFVATVLVMVACAALVQIVVDFIMGPNRFKGSDPPPAPNGSAQKVG